MADNHVVAVDGLSVNYGNKRVLTNIHMDIEPGHIYGVLGPNGAGKSTLFKSILGLIDYNSGAIKIFGKEIKSVRKKIAYVPQKDEIDWRFPATVKDIVLMGRYPFKRLLQRINEEDHEIANQAMEEMGIADLKDRQIGALSGGQQQRVFIARALTQQADLFFFDEPFVGIDITTENKIIEIMRKLASQGKTLLVVHHDLSTVEEYFDMVILLNQRLIACGSTKSVFNNQTVAETYRSQLTILQQI